MLENKPQNKSEKVKNSIESTSSLSPENVAVLKSVEDAIDTSNQETFQDVEQQVAKVLQKVEAPASSYQKLAKGLKETFAKSNTKKLVAGIFFTLLSQMPSFAANAENPNDNVLENSDNIESVITAEDTNKDEGKTYEYGGGNDPEDDTEKDLENPEDGIEKFEKIFDAGFEMGKADLSPEQVAELKAEFIDFLDSLPQEVKDRINSGESKIVIEGSTSYHVIDQTTGTDSGSRGQVFDNKTLAEYRAQEGVKALQDNVLDGIEGIDSAQMETSIRQYTQEDAGGVIEEGRRLRISIEDSVERTASQISLEENVINNLPNGHIEFILNDASGSNKGHAGALYEAAKDAGYIQDGEKIDLFVGTTHRDVIDAGKISYGGGADNLTRQEQNDRTNKFSDREQMVNASAKVLMDQPYVPTAERTPGETKIGVVVTDESIDISLKQLEKMQSTEVSKDTKLVYMLADRETRETTSLTLDQIKNILVNELGADNNPEKKFSLDVNKIEIQGGSADYIIQK